MIPPPLTVLLLPEIVVLINVAKLPSNKPAPALTDELLAIRQLVMFTVLKGALLTPPVKPFVIPVLLVIETPVSERFPPNVLAIPPPVLPTIDPPFMFTVPPSV